MRSLFTVCQHCMCLWFMNTVELRITLRCRSKYTNTRHPLNKSTDVVCLHTRNTSIEQRYPCAVGHSCKENNWIPGNKQHLLCIYMFCITIHKNCVARMNCERAQRGRNTLFDIHLCGYSCYFSRSELLFKTSSLKCWWCLVATIKTKMSPINAYIFALIPLK